MSNRFDNFTAPDSINSFAGRIPSDGGSAWIVYNGIWGISNNSAYVSTVNAAGLVAGSAQAHATLQSNSSVGQITHTVTETNVGLILRFVDINNFWLLYLPNLQLIKVVNGVETVLRSGNSVFFGQVVKFSVNIFDGWSVSVNGKEIYPTFIDSTHSTGTQVGLRGYDTSSYFLDFNYQDTTGLILYTGESSSEYGNLVFTSDYLLINNTDSLYTDASNNTFGINSYVAFDSFYSNDVDLLYIDASNNTLSAIPTTTTNPTHANVVYSYNLVGFSNTTSDIGGSIVANATPSQVLITGTSKYDYGGVPTIFESLLINDVDLLLLDNFNNNLNINTIQVTDGLLINDTDVLYIDASNNILEYDLIAVALENPSYATMSNMVNMVGSVTSSDSVDAHITYNINYTGVSQQEVDSSAFPHDVLLINEIDSLYADEFLNRLEINSAPHQFATLIADYFAVGTSTSTTNAFYVASNSSIFYTGNSNSVVSGNSIAIYNTRYVGESTSINTNTSSIAGKTSLVGNSVLNSEATSNVEFLINASGNVVSTSDTMGVLSAKLNYVGEILSDSDLYSNNIYTYFGVGISQSTPIITANLSGNADVLALSISISAADGFGEFSIIVDGTSTSSSNLLADIRGDFYGIGNSESYTYLNGTIHGESALTGQSNFASSGFATINGTLGSIGTSESFTIGSAKLSGRYATSGISTSNTIVNVSISGKTSLVGRSNPINNTTVIGFTEFDVSLLGNSTSYVIATSKLFAPNKLVGISASNSNINASIAGKTALVGASESESNNTASSEYSYLFEGLSKSVNINRSALTGIRFLSGNSDSNTIVDGYIRLLGLTTPQDQLALNELLLNSPDRTVNALRSSTSISLDKSDFF